MRTFRLDIDNFFYSIMRKYVMTAANSFLKAQFNQ